MPSHEEMIDLQAKKHGLYNLTAFRTKEEYVSHVMHTFAYVQASRLAEGKTVLDLGCNTGYGSEILLKYASKVTGVDVSEKAISTAKTQYGHLPINFQVFDGKQLPFENNKFDMVVNCQVIEHIVDYDVYLTELKRVLTPKGMVFITTPNALTRLDPGMKPWNKFHVHEFDHSELESLLKSYFSNVHILGLFAKEPFYSIELNSFNRARETARKRSRGGIISYSENLLRSIIKKMLPDPILKKIKRVLKSSTDIKNEIDENFIAEHGIQDLFYRSKDLNMALGLLAICSDDDSVLQKIEHKLSIS